MREMSEVILYYDGTYEINNLGKSDLVTQHLFGVKQGKHMELYYCIKGKENYYLKKLAKNIIAEKENKIRELTNEKYKLIGIFEELLK